MSNFDFVRITLPSLHGDLRPRGVVCALRSALGVLLRPAGRSGVVDYLYDVLGLPEPYRDALASRMNDAAFMARVPRKITEKMAAIRRLANTAVHETREIRPDAAQAVLRELFHVIVWTSYHHSPRPDATPLGAQFNPVSPPRQRH